MLHLHSTSSDRWLEQVDQNLAQSRALIPAPDYRLPDIPPRKRAEAERDDTRSGM